MCHNEAWRTRYREAKARLTTEIRSAPRELGPLPGGKDPYERSNLWLFETALSYGADKLQFVCLWDGGGGDGQEARRICIKKRKGRLAR